MWQVVDIFNKDMLVEVAVVIVIMTPIRTHEMTYPLVEEVEEVLDFL
jgi:hypothetical protein